MEQGWHPQDIIAEVRKRGSSLARLTREHGFSRDVLYKCLTQRFPNGHNVVAAAIGQTKHALWPQWYDQNDLPKFKTRRDLARKVPPEGFATLPKTTSFYPVVEMERAA